MIREVLDEAGVELGDLDTLVLGNGPGSFIGMRIAASVAQGLAYGSGLSIVPVSSLAAVAAQVFADTDAGEVAVAQDAHMNEVYLGLFRRGPQGLPVDIEPERLHGMERLEELVGDKPIAAGFGWRRYPELFANNSDLLAGSSDVLYPKARFLLPLGAAAFERGEAVDPKALNPAYLRQKVAEKPAPAT